MTLKQHHLLCLGLLAKLYHDAPAIFPSDYQAIREAFQSAEQLGLPVSAAKLVAREPVATNQPEDFEKL